jgi:hypothetical protein
VEKAREMPRAWIQSANPGEAGIGREKGVAKVSERRLVLDGAQSYHDGRGRKHDPNPYHTQDLFSQLGAGPHPERIGWLLSRRTVLRLSVLRLSVLRRRMS